MISYFQAETGHFTVDNVYCKYHIADRSKPIAITFAGAGDFILAHLTSTGISPWGHDFVKSRGHNVISFASIDRNTWYRSAIFESFIDDVAMFISTFDLKVGYGGSMGGFGVSAFSNKLGLDRVLLINPISTLNKAEASWDTRFSWAYRYDWESGCFDGNHVSAPGYVVYDPLHRIDNRHAHRYGNNIKHLRIYGVGHSMARHLQNMGMLKRLYEEFVSGEINEQKFYVNARARRRLEHYYNRQLLPNNDRLTPLRTEILTRHRIALKRKRYFEALGYMASGSVPLTDLTLIPSISYGKSGFNHACNDTLLRIGAMGNVRSFAESWGRGAGFLKNGGLKYYNSDHLRVLLNVNKVTLSGNFDVTRASNSFVLGFLFSLRKNIGTVLVSEKFKIINVEVLSPEERKRVNEFRKLLNHRIQKT